MLELGKDWIENVLFDQALMKGNNFTNPVWLSMMA